MNQRRHFLKSAATVGALGTCALGTIGPLAMSAQPAVHHTDAADDRRFWIAILDRLARPVLTHLARHELKQAMPVEAADPDERRPYTHLEAFGRLLAGIAPWLEAPAPESTLQNEYIELVHRSLDAATNPASPDFMNFTSGGQPLVDTAFLAQALLRAPRVLMSSLDDRIRQQLIAALKSSRTIPTPTQNNWTMFAATVEAALLALGEPTQEDRLESCVRRMLGWYKGDGVYGDGESFHFDYYNSFVIHPMLVDVLATLNRIDPRFEIANTRVLERSRRFARIQERLIAPDGTFPCVGRSMTYRCGAFQTLAQMTLLQNLPADLQPSQVRNALTQVLRRTIEAPGTFDQNGWLRIGLYGHQPSLAEHYISTGSLYLCAAILLPLGLPATDSFWKDPALPWSSQQLLAGEALSADHALDDAFSVEVPTLKRIT